MSRLLTLEWLALTCCLGLLAGCGKNGQVTPPTTAPNATSKPAKPDEAETDPTPAFVELDIQLPKPQFKGTPKHAKSDNLEAPRKGPRPAFNAPAGCKRISSGKPVISSDTFPIIGEVDLVTDGDKEANEGSYVELGPMSQHVQIDLGQNHAIHAIVIWQFHMNARIYKDVVVRVSDDPDFVEYETVFNNDHDNSSGYGVGEDKEYWETNEGKLIDAKGSKGRYVRIYSNGNTEDDQNHHTEVEVWGL